LNIPRKRCRLLDSFFFNTPRSYFRFRISPSAPNSQPIDSDELGNPPRLHPRLDHLPLHPDGDGWYSVLGPSIGTSDNPATVDVVKEANQESNATIQGSPVNPSRNSCLDLPRIFCQYHKCTGASGPHTCAPGRFTCEAPNCPWSRTFKTKQAFNRHYHVMHGNDRVDCPVEGCENVRARGIKRADNLPAHLLNKHGISSARPPYGN
ncbi:unnamed protein product, partial [Tuber aestivum]